MKKKKEKAIVKESRKAAKKELTQQILTALSTFTINAKKDKKTEKLIAKYAQQLAKRLSKNAAPVVEVILLPPPALPEEKKVITPKAITPKTITPKAIVKKEEPKV